MDSFKKFAADAVTDVLSKNTQQKNENGNGSNADITAAATNILGKLDGALSNANKENKEGNANVANTLLSKLDGALGGGQKAEQKEDLLDKAVDLLQEHVFKAGPQTNESAVEQAKDKAIADAIRTGYKSVTGKDIPI